MGLSGLAPSQPVHGLHFVYFGGGGVLERGREALPSYHLQMGLVLAEKEASAQLERLLGNLSLPWCQPGILLRQLGHSGQQHWGRTFY